MSGQQSRVTIIAELKDKLTGTSRKMKASAEDMGHAIEDAGKRAEKSHAAAGKAAEKQAEDTRAASGKIDKAMADAGKATAQMERALNRAGVKWDGTLDGIVRDTDRGADRIDRALARAGVQGGQRMLGNLKSAGNRFVQEAQQIGKQAGDKIAAGIEAGVGAIDSSGLAQGGGALGAGAGVIGALERDRAVRRAAAAGGSDPDMLQGMTDSAYSAGLGEDYGQVLTTTTSLMAAVDVEPGSREAEALLLGQQSIIDAYQLDPGQLGIVVGMGVELDGRAAEDVQDTLVAALKAAAPGARDEIAEALIEYTPVLAGTGVTQETLAAYLSASSDMGPMAVDKTGDALKEGAVRLASGDKAAIDAVSGVGLNAADVRGRMLAGDETAWSDINSSLLNVEDPVVRSQAAIEIYGAPMEDLGPGQIDEYLAAWNEIENLDAKGATSDLTDALTSGEGADSVKMMRALSGAFIDIGDALAPILTPVFELVSLLAKPIALAATGAGLFGILKRIPGLGNVGKGAIGGLSGSLGGLGGVLRAHPLLALAGVVYAGVEAFGYLYENVEAVRVVVDGAVGAFDAIDQKFRDIGQSIEDLIRDKIPSLNKAMDNIEGNTAAMDDGKVQEAIDKTGPMGGNPVFRYVQEKTGIDGWLDENMPWRKDDGGEFAPVPAHADGGFTRGDGIYRAGERGREFIVPASATNALESSAPGALATMASTGALPAGGVVHQNTFHLAPGVTARDADAFAAQWEAKMDAYNRRQGHTYGTMSRRGGR